MVCLFPLYLKAVIIVLNAQALFLNVMVPTNGYEVLWLGFIYSHVPFLLSRFTFISCIISHRTHIFRLNKCFALFIHIFCLMVLWPTGQQWVWRTCIIFFLINVYNWYMYMNLTVKTVWCIKVLLEKLGS